MWIVKEQSKGHPNGVPASPVMQTQSGADTICGMLQKEADANRKENEEPRHYFVAQHIKRGDKDKK